MRFILLAPLSSKFKRRPSVLPVSFNLQRFYSLENDILNELLKILKSGKAPEKFNFSRDIFDRHVVHRPTSTALWFDNDQNEERKWTFAQLQTESIRTAIFLRKTLNLPNSSNVPSKSPFILTVLSRIPEWWFLHLAAIRIGTIFCPGTTMLTSQDIQYRLEASAAQIIITDESNVEKIDESQKGSNKLSKKLKKVVVRSKDGNSNSIGKDWIDFNDCIKDISDTEVLSFKNTDTLSKDVAQVYFTSGTTGKPKMVAHTHASYGIGHYTTVKMLDLKSTDVIWNISDPGWAKSSYSNFFAPWTTGTTVYIHQMERFEAKKVLKELSEKPITTFCGPPTLYKSMVQEEDDLFKMKSLRFCLGGGEPVSPEVARVWKLKTGVVLNEGYGQTEMTVVDCKRSTKEGSMGIPNGFLDLRVVDESCIECPPNVEGQTALKIKPSRPIGLFKGYMKGGPDGPEMDTEKNASCFIGDYYLTGDRAYKDESGHLFYVGRADDVINSAGYRIGPSEIEAVLQTHPAVVESAAVASPDLHRNEVVKAFIVLTQNYKDVDKEKLTKEIQEHVKKNTAPYKYPRKVEFVESLPKTVSGKILRRELKKQEFEKAGKS